MPPGLFQCNTDTKKSRNTVSKKKYCIFYFQSKHIILPLANWGVCEWTKSIDNHGFIGMGLHLHANIVMRLLREREGMRGCGAWPNRDPIYLSISSENWCNSTGLYLVISLFLLLLLRLLLQLLVNWIPLLCFIALFLCRSGVGDPQSRVDASLHVVLGFLFWRGKTLV